MDFNKFFTKIASDYDRIIDALSFGLDKALLKEVLAESKLGASSKKVLDVATGTGRVALAIAKKYPSYEVVGIDINSNMLANAMKKSRKVKNVKYMIGDVESLDFPEGYFDIVISAFSLGLFNDLGRALCEMQKVLKPKGKIILIDMLKPRDSIMSKLVNLYYSINVIPALDSRIRRDVEAYIKSFRVDKSYVIEKLKLCGFKSIKEKEISGGLAFIIIASKASKGHAKAMLA
ncbi:MAG: class I SAM-dependent methyltransferase [Candidatus Micrarchaeia archaeon]|jgi:demethylmenaquinone methyltransferase/2-methoxy-6-polyprenyl-1,4-benzoquinol methylase